MAFSNHTTFDANMQSSLSIFQDNCAYSECMTFGNHTMFDANMQGSLRIFQNSCAYSERMAVGNHTMFDAIVSGEQAMRACTAPGCCQPSDKHCILALYRL